MNLQTLPTHLQERSRIVQSGSADSDAQFVMYWMVTAVRTDENPALDVAKQIAAEKDLPLLVYHAVSQSYRYASDRHHTFIMEGAANVQAEFARDDIAYAFHLETSADDGPHLRTLAQQAAVVVTEDMPTNPQRSFLKTLARGCDTTIVCVDTACVVPMQLVGVAHTRAFKFRNKTKKLLAERLTARWPKCDAKPRKYDLNQLPFQPVDFFSASIADLVAQADIDHAVGKVVDTRGGSFAGYERWERFKENGLTKYARRRNNAAADGVSRMSAYLHYGMVSPMRIAREAADIQNAGSEKYLDELLIWRELAYCFCFYTPRHDSLSAIPDWAQTTLRQHADDHRPEQFTWEQLARGETGDELWDAAQQSLLMQGELHNNVRMTWGKAFLNWTSSAQQALRMMVDLNHRYALDGRDPASYGGLLWCLGQFDRPFDPEQSVIGTVRPRPTKDHARRMDLAAYQDLVTTPRFAPIPNVAIIGAGMSGLFAARTLADHGVKVTILEKSRGAGGRMATRRLHDVPTFDHGAQYFTARNQHFKRYVKSWQGRGLVAPWPEISDNTATDQRIVVIENGVIKSESKSVGRFVGTPSMKSVCNHLADDITVFRDFQVASLEQQNGMFVLHDANGAAKSDFTHVVLAIPAEQAADLLATAKDDAFESLKTDLRQIEMLPCWAVMASFEQPIADDWCGAFIHDSNISWVARNSTKLGRPDDLEHLVIHAHPEWTQAHWDDDPADVCDTLIADLFRATAAPQQSPTHAAAHRWKYSIPSATNVTPKEKCFANDNKTVIVCGDWAAGARVEGAFLSGMAAAGQILNQLQYASPNTKQTMLF